MKLSELLQATEVIRIIGSLDPEITGLHYDSRSVAAGGLFFAVKGVNADGHDFIPAAVANGAAALVVENSNKLPAGMTAVEVADSRLAMAQIAAAFYGRPT